MENITQTVEIQSRAGGVGVNLSTLRPRGARVRKVNGTSSGPVNWAALYSTANHDVIQQGGSRRGALMLMINDWHPDVEEFITVKQDLTKIPGANLSVCVSDAFMEAVAKDGDWYLAFPDISYFKYDEEWDGDLEKWKSKGYPVSVHKTIKAKVLWSMIAEAAWKSAEPGVVFIDRYNKLSNTWYFEKIIATNPCLTGDALVSTDKGLITIKELHEKRTAFKVLIDGRLSDVRFQVPQKVVETGKKQVYRLITREGYELRLTGDHKVLTEKGWIKALDLKMQDRIFISNRKGGFGEAGSLDEGQVLGWLVGDGTLKATSAVLSFFGEEKRELAPRFAQMVDQMVAGSQLVNRAYPVGSYEVAGRDEARVASDRLFRYVVDKGVEPGNKLKVPNSVLGGSEQIQRGFLQGLFTADGHVGGTVEKGVSVRLTSISEVLLKDVQRILLNFGITSRIYTQRRKKQIRLLPDGKGGRKGYLCKEYSDLVVSCTGLVAFARKIGFLSSAKNLKLEDLLKKYKEGPYRENFVVRFKKIMKEGVETVYDLTEPATSSFIANGLVVHNCGEQGLGAWGVCNLGHLNLPAFVKDGQMDYGLLADHAATATRFLDNVVNANYYFYEQNKKAQFNIRRTGLGTLGLADALIKMKVKYGTEESLKIIEQVYITIRDSAYETSSLLAKEKGSFGGFNREKYLKGAFIQKLPERIKKSIAKNGIRNAVILTQAPTGTISLLAGVSSGIEPVYEFSYRRNDRTGEHIVNHPLYQEWLDNHKDEKIPDYFVSAGNLTPEDHVRVQAAIQNLTDSSISKTVNAPNSHTVDDVKKLYMLAYELGCKGITYFRDGSRTGVLSKVEEKKEEQKTIILERPLKVEGATYRIPTPLGVSFITVNQDPQGAPFEVFITIGKAGSEVAALAEALGRMISTTLRFGNHKPPIERAREIMEQLKGIGGGRSVGFGPNKIRSLPDAVAKALSLHFNFETKELSESFHLASVEPQVAAPAPVTVKNGDICPSCGASALVYEEGCAKCHICGHSEC